MKHEILRVLISGLAMLALAGCRTLAPLAPVNLSEPGWKMREGQVLWRTKRGAPEIAGELLVATHPAGRAWIQFIKTPLPLVAAQTSASQWEIEFIPEKRRAAGTGAPPVQLIWLHLLRALNGIPPPAPFEFNHAADGSWSLENKMNGEMLSGYLSP